MKKLLIGLRDTFIAGLVFLVPILLLLVLLLKVLHMLESFTLKLSGLFGMKQVMGVPPHMILGIMLLLLICLLCGYLVRVAFFKQFSEWADLKLRRLIPGYGLYHRLILSRLQKQEATASHGTPAWFRNEDGLQPVFIMETLSGDRLVIFIPTAGNIKEGVIFLVAGERVSRCSNQDVRAFRLSIANLGVGMDSFVLTPE